MHDGAVADGNEGKDTSPGHQPERRARFDSRSQESKWPEHESVDPHSPEPAPERLVTRVFQSTAPRLDDSEVKFGAEEVIL